MTRYVAFAALLLIATSMPTEARSARGLSARPSYPLTVQDPPRLRSELDTTQMALGDRILLTVTVDHEEGSTVRWPDSLELGSFEVISDERLEPVRQEGRVLTAMRFTITAFEVGDVELPSISVLVTPADGSEPVSLATDSWIVEVASVGLDEGGDIRDIKGPLEIPRNWLLSLPILLAALAIGAVGYWLYRRYRQRASVGAGAPETVLVRPPHEIALEALAQLEESGLLERGDVKEYFIGVSEIVRRYIEGRYQVDALEMATYEVADGLDRVGVSLETRLEFERFLSDCDLVKFAKWVPEMGFSREMVGRARGLVEGTREVGEVGEGGDGESIGAGVARSPMSTPVAAPSSPTPDGGEASSEQ